MKKKIANQAKKHKKLAKEAGIFYCVECDCCVDLQSDHILSQHYYPQLRLKMWNLCIRCQECNQKNSDKFYWEMRSFVVLFRMCFMESVRALALASIGIYCYEENAFVLNLINTGWLYFR